MKYEIKKKIFEEIALTKSFNQLTCIQIPKKDFYSKSSPLTMFDDDEFEFNGNMYDIVKKVETENQIIFYCINDVKEERLLLSFHKIADDVTKTKNNSSSTKTVIQTLILLGIAGNIFSPEFYPQTFLLKQEYTINYKSFKKENLTPPPRNPFLI